MLHPDRFFSPDPGQDAAARELNDGIKDLPLIYPHEPVTPRLCAGFNYEFGCPSPLGLCLPVDGGFGV